MVSSPSSTSHRPAIDRAGANATGLAAAGVLLGALRAAADGADRLQPAVSLVAPASAVISPASLSRGAGDRGAPAPARRRARHKLRPGAAPRGAGRQACRHAAPGNPGTGPAAGAG